MRIAKGIVRTRTSHMNATEANYSLQLLARQRLGEIALFEYEALTLRLADRTTYTPDFMVMLTNGELELHEVKGGFVREDAWIKLKIAADTFPFRFILAQYTRENGWKIERV